MGVAMRDAYLNSSSGSTTTTLGLPACQVGDRLLVIVGGGNQVTGFSAGWDSLAFYTGQEAQGRVLTKVATSTDAASGSIQLSFDGGDARRIVLVSTVGAAEVQLFEVGRDGTAGATLAPYVEPVAVTPSPDELVLSYVFCRNATTMPASDHGALTFYDDASPTAGFWVDATNGDDYTEQLSIPQRSGHFRAVVCLWQKAAGAWHDDSVPVSITTASGDTESTATADGRNGASPFIAGTDDSAWATAFEAAYNSPTISAGSFYHGSLDGDLSGIGGTHTRATWSQAWVTVVRTGDATVTSGELPPTVVDADGNFLDPNVVGVEWEPTSTVVSQELGVEILNTSAAGVALAYGTDFHVKLQPSVDPSAPYWPGFKTPAALRALGDALTFPSPPDLSSTNNPPAILADPAVPKQGAAALAVSLVDDYANRGVPLPRPSGTTFASLRYPFRAWLQAYYKPRYRLLYRGPVPVTTTTRAPLLRKYPLDIGRKWPPSKAQQYGGRRVGGYQ